MLIGRHAWKRVLPLATYWLIGTQAVSASALERQDPGAAERYVHVLALKGEGNEAISLAEAHELALDRADFGPVHRTIADLYVESGEIERGRDLYETRLRSNPEDARAFYGLSRMDIHEGKLESAIEHLKRSIALDPSFAEPFGLRGGLAEAYELRRDLSAAVRYFEDLTRSTPDSAPAHAGLGWSYARSFQFEEAVQSFRRSIALDPTLVQAHAGLVQSYFRTGQHRLGREACEALRVVAEPTGDLEMVAYAEMVQGSTAWTQGDYRAALNHLHEAQRIAEEIGDTRREASVTNNTAAVYATAGEYERALQSFQRSLEIAKQTPGTQTEVNALINIGSVYKLLGSTEDALASYGEAVELSKNAGYTNRQCEALANMGEAFHLDGRLEEAQRHYDESLRIARATQNRTIEAFVLGQLGRLSRDRGAYAGAIDSFERELALGRETGEVEATWEAEAGLGSTYRARGDVDRAIVHYARAIEQYDAAREDLAIESIGASFLEDKYDAYPSIVELLAETGRLEDAFSYAEKYKAKGFLDILARGQTLFETHLPEALRRDLDRIRADLQAAYAARSRNPDGALEERITGLELRKAELLDRVREEHGEFFQLALSEPLEASAIQSDVLEPQQTLLQYVIGTESLSVFVISRDEVRYRVVPVGRTELRRKLAELSPLFLKEESRAPFVNADLADFSIPEAYALYEALIAPVAEWLPETGQLIIVPDDFLFYLPFELLIVENEGAEHRYDFSSVTFLVERYAVSYSASASLLDPRRWRERDFEKGVLAFGNATSTSEDQPALPHSQAEVEAIQRAFRDLDNGVFTRERATKDVFTEQAGDYGVLHFATHFLSDDRQPLYSSIVLADRDVLQTFEIFDADLSAELAVLSACNTGLGKLKKGEGLIGITRAFLYAGVPSLVVSLWSVDDESTSVIMEFFYRHLRSGASKNQALRRAKLDYLSQASGEQRDPFYWAPFVLNGGSAPLTLPPTAIPRWRPRALAGLGLLITLGLALLAWQRRAARK